MSSKNKGQQDPPELSPVTGSCGFGAAVLPWKPDCSLRSHHSCCVKEVQVARMKTGVQQSGQAPCVVGRITLQAPLPGRGRGKDLSLFSLGSLLGRGSVNCH